jgi:IS605 OrfB family transposase
MRKPCQSIQAICQEYAKARKQFGKRRLKWRSRKRSLGWIPFKVSGIKLIDDAIRYGSRLFRLWLSREIEGKIKTGSFTQDTRGRWYVNLQCEVEDEPQLKLGLHGVGIDLGVQDQIACSDMDEPESRDNLTRKYEDDLAMAQRAGKKKRVKAIHAKIKNARKDWTHKRTTEIARHADFIAVGDVSSTQLAKTKMAKSTYDAGWGMLRHQLHYKAIRLAGICVPVCESFTSVTCSACLARSGPSGLGGLVVRVWTCSHCGVSHHRDINAAKNILRLGRQTPIKGIPSL